MDTFQIHKQHEYLFLNHFQHIDIVVILRSKQLLPSHKTYDDVENIAIHQVD